MCKPVSWCNTGRFGYGSHLSKNNAGIRSEKLIHKCYRPGVIILLKNELKILLSKKLITEAYVLLWDSPLVSVEQKSAFEKKFFRKEDLQ